MSKKTSKKKTAKKARRKIRELKPTLSKQDQDFLCNVGIAQECWPSSRISVENVRRIYDDYMASQDMLLPVANAILETLRKVPEVHSLKMRLKDPKHLAKKIVRKVKERANFKPTVNNYRRLITDLIGIRALHLFKDEWKPIHDFIINTWDSHERPIVYIRDGDSTDVFSGVECDIKKHERAYRSVHCTIGMTPTKEKTIAEIQVRTLFEEGWSEIDHQVRYPSGESDPLLSQFLVIFNRLSGSADEMGSYIKMLQNTLQQQRIINEEHLQKKEKELQAVIEKLKITDRDRKRLQQKLDDLPKQSLLSDFTFELDRESPSLNIFSIPERSPSVLESPFLAKITCSSCGKAFQPAFGGQSTCNSCLLG